MAAKQYFCVKRGSPPANYQHVVSECTFKCATGKVTLRICKVCAQFRLYSVNQYTICKYNYVTKLMKFAIKRMCNSQVEKILRIHQIREKKWLRKARAWSGALWQGMQQCTGSSKRFAAGSGKIGRKFCFDFFFIERMFRNWFYGAMTVARTHRQGQGCECRSRALLVCS